MAELIFGDAPNTVAVEDSYSTDTNWHIVATDGTGYATLAALKAAGKKPFGCAGLDPGLFFQVVNVTTDNGSAGTSSGGYIAFNRTVAPASTPQGEGFMSPGLNRTYPGRFWNVWVQKLATTDRWFFEAKF